MVGGKVMIVDLDLYRSQSKGQYDTDFSFLNKGSTFPSAEVQGRNAVYRYRHRQYTGEYAKNKKLFARINDIEQEIPYRVISVNYFKLISNKMTDLVFNNEINIKTGDIQRDKLINALIERTNWRDTIRKAFKLCTEYGDACIKTYKDGASAFAPLNCFKVVDESDISKTKAYVLYEYIYSKVYNTETLKYIRYEIHLKGKIYECVREYSGGTVGSEVSLKYRGREIPKGGNWYDTGIDDCELVQWLSINEEADGVYGESIYTEIQDIVYAIEQRISTSQHALDNSINPFITIGASAMKTWVDKEGNEHTGLRLIDGKFLPMVSSEDGEPKAIELNYNLSPGMDFMGLLQSFLYELSEMGKTYLSGEYSGNISEETLSNTIKSAIDKGNRLITEVYKAFRDSLYCLCLLNGIAIKKEDITIIFNVGRTDDDMKVAEVCKVLVECGILSKATTREKYFGYNKEQSDNEDKQIELERLNNSKQFINNNINNKLSADVDNKIINNEFKEDIQNDVA